VLSPKFQKYESGATPPLDVFVNTVVAPIQAVVGRAEKLAVGTCEKEKQLINRKGRVNLNMLII
jgi:hypothetical protein